jgi:hypothetical protein
MAMARETTRCFKPVRFIIYLSYCSISLKLKQEKYPFSPGREEGVSGRVSNLISYA